MTNSSTTNLHIYFLLDRSGSMTSVASNVIGGFNSFVASQKTGGEDALMTFAQFDGEKSHEVLANAAALDAVPRLDETVFLPRGGTPPYDARCRWRFGGGDASACPSTTRRRRRDRS